MEEARVLRVNTLTDENDGSAESGSGLSLRDAVLIANSTPEDEIIELESDAVYELTIAGEDPEDLFEEPDGALLGDLDIGSTGGTLTIRGLGDGATIDAKQISRVIQVRGDFRGNGATLILENVTITGGVGIAEDITDDGGGGIYIDDKATAELTNCTITGNSAPGSGDGGGIYNGGTLTIRDCDINGNSAGNGGGIATSFGNTQIFDSTITNNSANQVSNDIGIGDGGGILQEAAGTTEIVGSTIAGNSASFRGGGFAGVSSLGNTDGIVIIRESTFRENTANSGGGVASGGVESFTVESSTIENNIANDSGGGLAVASILDDVQITDSTIRNNTAAADGGGIGAGGTVRVEASTISNNSAGGDGGGISSSLSTALISNSLIAENTAGDAGGGLSNVEIIIDSTIQNNRSVSFGGGMFTLDPGLIINSTFSGNETESSGGGLSVIGNPTGSAVAIANSTFHGNRAQENGGAIDIGGGLIEDTPNAARTDFISNVQNIPGEIFAANLTITENVADSDGNGTGDGGGIHNPTSFTLGSDDPAEGGRTRFSSGNVSLSNSILAGNVDNSGNSGEGAIAPNISGAARGNANNLTGDLTGLTIESVFVAPEAESLGQGSDILNSDPRLGALQDNGGGVPTRALLAGSPAIDAGDNASIFPETFLDLNNNGEQNTFDFNEDGDNEDQIPYDQRGDGFERIFNGTVDIGAYEVQENEPVPEPEPSPGDGGGSGGENTGGESGNTLELFRFRNTTFDSGTYVFVGGAEKDAILADTNLSNTFSLDGEQADGSINPAFIARTTPGENLIPFFRLKSLDVPGTFLFVSTAEYNGIFADDSDQRDKWEQEGLDAEGEDIPEFYLLDGASDTGTAFNRFQNTQNGTFLYAGEAETTAIENDPNLNSLFTNQGVAFNSL